MVTAKQQLDSFLAKYDPTIAARTRRMLVKMRKRLPGAIELVYDNYNALVIGFSPNERPSDAIFSLAVQRRWVSLCFLQNGGALPDPDGRLLGSGKVARHVVLETDKTFDEPAIQRLMQEGLQHAKVPLDAGQKRQLIIRSISAKQRPRRPGAK